MTPTPEEMLAAARAGRGDALGRLFEQYRHYLLLQARAQVGRGLQGKLDPLDVVQDAFLEAHRHFDQFRGGTERELMAWLRQILASCLGKSVRRYFGTRRRDARLERELAAGLDESSRALDRGLVAKQSSPSHQAARREQAVLLANALGQLAPDHREVLVLRNLDGLSFPEVAQRMGRSADAVKKLWTRALDRLRRTLEAAS